MSQKPPRPNDAHRFVLLCLRCRIDPAAAVAVRDMLHGEVDWAGVQSLARRERLAPLVHHAIREFSEVPPAEATWMYEAYRRTAVRNAALLRRLVEALEALSAGQVPVIVLKGGALCQTLYGNIALRPLGDIDLLVRPAHRESALRVLTGLGYAPRRREPRPGTLARHENELSLRRGGGLETDIDLHWSLFDSPHHQAIDDSEWYWSTAGSFRVLGVEAQTLGPEAQLLHLCGHLMLHHQGNGLLWAHDIAELLTHGRRLDWALVLARARTLDLVLPLRTLLPRLAAEWIAPVPAPVLEALRRLEPSSSERRSVARFGVGGRSPARRLWHDIATSPHWKDRVNFAWANVFPSTSYMRERYAVRHPLLLPLYYPYRWWLGLRSRPDRS